MVVIDFFLFFCLSKNSVELRRRSYTVHIHFPFLGFSMFFIFGVRKPFYNNQHKMSISHIDRYDEKTLIWISTNSGTMGKYDVETSQCHVLLENLKRPISVRVRDSSVYVLEEGKTEREGRLIKYNMDSGYVCIMLTRLCNARGMYVTSNHDVLFSEAEDETALPDPTETCTLSSICPYQRLFDRFSILYMVYVRMIKPFKNDTLVRL